LVRPQRTLQRMAAQALDELAATYDDPGLRTAQQLVAGEAHEICACSKRLASRWLVADVDERAGTEVVDQRQSMAQRHRGELLQARLLGEADDAEVGLVHAEQECRVVRHRPVVVGSAR